MSKLTIDEISEGDEFSFEALIEEEMVDHFARLSGDCSPIHVEQEFAKSRGFKGRVVHGVLVTSLLSRLVGMHLPGENALLQSMNIQFINPVYIGDLLTVTGVVDQVAKSVNTVILKAKIVHPESSQCLIKAKISVGFTCLPL